MTKVSIYDIDNHICVSAHDHATGSNEVCAAVSCLMYTLEGYLQNNEAKVKNHKATFKDGFAVVEFDAIDFDVYHGLECVIVGLLLVQGSYPDYLKVDLDSDIAHIIGVGEIQKQT